MTLLLLPYLQQNHQKTLRQLLSPSFVVKPSKKVTEVIVVFFFFLNIEKKVTTTLEFCTCVFQFLAKMGAMQLVSQAH